MDALSTGLGLGLNNNTTAGGGEGFEIVEREILKVVGAAKTRKDGDVGGEGGVAGEGDSGAGRGGGEGREGKESRVLLVLDGLDFLLAATGTTALQIGDLVGELRSVRYPLSLFPSPSPPSPPLFP